MTLKDKEKILKEKLKSYGKILVAYSGGVDSTFLLKFAVDCIGCENVGAVIEKGALYPEEEIEFAKNFAKGLGIKLFVISSNQLKDKKFSKNPVNRCFYCKKSLFSRMSVIAKKNGFDVIADGSNLDDLSDFRPGNRAKSMYGVVSPLQEAGLKKNEIRVLSKKLGLPTWNKPQMACLASRIPYGEKITRKRLKKIWLGEKYLRSLGFSLIRVRDYNNMCRIEVAENEIRKLLNLKEKIVREFKKIGYHYITVDLEGYTTGSMNKAI